MAHTVQYVLLYWGGKATFSSGTSRQGHDRSSAAAGTLNLELSVKQGKAGSG